MREILFRAKRTDNHQWVEGFYIVDDMENPNPYIVNSRGKYRVAHRSVGQLSGVKDLTGRKIFEGDIMETAVSGLMQHTGVVEFIDGSFGLKCTDGSAFFLCFVAGCYKVIGNIHDNPELLEGGVK